MKYGQDIINKYIEPIKEVEQDIAGLDGLRNEYDLIRGVPSEDRLGVKGLKQTL